MSDDPSNPGDDPQPLGYRNPADDKPVHLRQIGPGCGGILGLVAVLACGFFWVINNIDSGRTEWVTPLAISVSILAVLGGIAAFQYFRRGNKLFFYGLVIGLLVGLLVEGVCFTSG